LLVLLPPILPKIGVKILSQSVKIDENNFLFFIFFGKMYGEKRLGEAACLR
jgi:hypothetical protein